MNDKNPLSPGFKVDSLDSFETVIVRIVKILLKV